MEKIKDILISNAETAEKVLTVYLSADNIGSGILQDAMRYSTLGGGKRIRACLTMEFCRCFREDISVCYPFAAAIEMIHAYSLIHDDLPCMDDDDMRRGKPSCHAAFGEAQALLAGDSLLSYAFETASSAYGVSAEGLRLSISALSHNSGPLGMTGGQMIDLENSVDSYENLKALHSMKTSALIKTACLCGYYSTIDTSVNDSIVSAIFDYAECLGLAFQIRDDILDLKGDPSSLGKKTQVDSANGRINALSYMSVEEAEAECDKLANRAANSIKGVCSSEFLSGLPFYLNHRMK
ncbi:MAG: polyprenyl synthetase family protein [Clostridia bacterium]|nr:polyprenyl synthetase family protein [Clostridia bacterium]